ncbi:hypothetical protein TNCV_1012061 [Trichonephila clavipes]|uniref:Uncharacterized protein n=1 Tax=Trichonephila clavipes TaxID=2585209 RepID=A0A8X7B9N8_TRICX|nr:hypothetical protein TNCV_1012061 [Trichonephila clavipes]
MSLSSVGGEVMDKLPSVEFRRETVSFGVFPLTFAKKLTVRNTLEKRMTKRAYIIKFRLTCSKEMSSAHPKL